MSAISGGFGFVELETAEDANAAIARLSGTELEGRRISVEVTRLSDAGGGARCGSGNGRNPKRSSMMNEPRLVDETRVRAVCDYLREACRAERVVPFVAHGVQGFRIEDIFGILRHVLSVSGGFFHAHTSQEIPSALRDFQVATALRLAGRTTVEVTTSGVRVLNPKPGEGERMSGIPEER